MWEMAEEDLARLFLALVEASHASNSPTRRAYGAIGSNSGRRKAIEAAAEAYFGAHWDNPTVRKSFFAIINAVQWASNRRDDFAHGVTLGNTFDNVPYGYFLFPPDYNTERTTAFLYPEKGDPLYFTAAKYRYTSDQIAEFGKKFQALQFAIQGHTGLIRKDGNDILFVRAVVGGDAIGG
jgi:hypothetical protein